MKAMMIPWELTWQIKIEKVGTIFQRGKNQAAEIVNRLAEQMGDEKLREGFTTAVTAHIL